MPVARVRRGFAGSGRVGVRAARATIRRGNAGARPHPVRASGVAAGGIPGEVSGDLDQRYGAPTSDRVADGWLASYARTHTLLTSIAAVTKGPAAAAWS